jgi:hypothetical protein
MTDNIRRNTVYGVRNALQRTNPLPIIAARNPTIGDNKFPIGQVWINQPTNNIWILTSISSNSANWEPVSEAAEASFPISIYIVDADGSAGYITVQSALDAANAAGGNASVYIRPGTYTENLTLYSTVNIIGDNPDTTIIVGVHVPPTSGSIAFYNIGIQSATNLFNTGVTVGTASIDLNNCITDVSTMLLDVPFWTGPITIVNTRNINATDGFIDNFQGSSLLTVIDSSVGSGGVNAAWRGNFVFKNVIIEAAILVGNPIAMAGTFDDCLFTANLTCNIGSDVTIRNSTFSTGTGIAISQISNIPLKLQNVVIDSTHATVIFGTSVVEMSEVTFPQGTTLAAPLSFAGSGSIASGGISFDGNSNIMSHYSTGTWTPALDFGGASVGITYNTQVGQYTRIGNLVTIFCDIELTSKGTSVGAARITPMPFQPLDGSTAAAGEWAIINLTANYTNVTLSLNSASVTININQVGDNVAAVNLTNVEFANNSTIKFFATYRT